MKKMSRYLALLMTFVICILSISAVPSGAVDIDVTESVSGDSMPAVKPLIPYEINKEQTHSFVKDGKIYNLYQAEMMIDFNDDGKCTAAEARILLRISANLEKFNGDLQIIDVSRDGRISATDARAVLRYSAKLDTYYLDENYDAISGFARNANGKNCYFGDAGVLVTGIKNIDGANYYFDSKGEMQTGLVTVGSDVYYFDENGKAVSGEKTIDGKTYIFDSTGKGKLKPTDPSQFKTAMIGDSIVATIGLYNVTDHIDFYGKVSLNSYSIFNRKISGSQRYVIDEVKDRGYDKVIILMGINEYGANVSTWKAQYKKIIDAVRERAPGAEIYVHAILPINDQRAAANGYTVKNSIIKPMNDALRELAKEENVKFIDAREVLADANGSLPYEAASDGIHLTKSYCDIWGDWLLEQICK